MWIVEISSKDPIVIGCDMSCDASEATDNSEVRTAAVNAADATEAATLKKPTGKLTLIKINRSRIIQKAS